VVASIGLIHAFPNLSHSSFFPAETPLDLISFFADAGQLAQLFLEKK